MKKTAANLLCEAKEYILTTGKIVKNWENAYETPDGTELFLSELNKLSEGDLAECRVCMLGAIAVIGKLNYEGTGHVHYDLNDGNPTIVKRALKALVMAHRAIFDYKPSSTGNIDKFLKRHNRAQITAVFDKAIEMVPRVRV